MKYIHLPDHGKLNIKYISIFVTLVLNINVYPIKGIIYILHNIIYILALGKESGMARAQLARRHTLHMLLYFTLAKDIPEWNNIIIINIILLVYIKHN